MRRSHEADSAKALAEIEAEADDYRKIAERRVRLGLLLSEIGPPTASRSAEQEMNRLISQAASQYQPKDRERFIQYVQQEPMAAAQLRAPLYEDKVVDFLFDKADITERDVTREELEADLESEEGHVHGPDCGHDHAEAAPKKAKAAAEAKAAQGKGRARRRGDGDGRGCGAEAGQAGQGWSREGQGDQDRQAGSAAEAEVASDDKSAAKKPAAKKRRR